MEIVAAGFFCRIHEQTVILLKTITPAARRNSRHVTKQRKGNPISQEERANSDFLSLKLAKPVRCLDEDEELNKLFAIDKPDLDSCELPIANCFFSPPPPSPGTLA
jgi:hypothetical protein